VDKPTSSTSKFKTRREILRRHRRERQVMLFGVLAVALGVVAFGAYSVYKGTIAGPFSQPYISNKSDFRSGITLPCPPSGSLPLDTGKVVVRVLNATTRSGLAGTVTTDLTGRGYYTLDPSNWSRTYEGEARIAFGVDGVQAGYTVARNFKNPELVLDTRKGAVVDVVVGATYGNELVAQTDPSLSPTLPLSARAQCENPRLIVAEPAPRDVPKDPRVSVSPSASPSH
jgi:hypothetical protein